MARGPDPQEPDRERWDPERLPEGLEVARIVQDPEPCSYLPGRMASLELRLFAVLDGEQYGSLLAEGHRRFGVTVFRPACEGCRECIPLRIPAARFRPSKSQRRVIRKNRDVVVEIGPPKADGERIALHRAFHRERSERAGWKCDEITDEEYFHAFVENLVETVELCYRIGGRLAAVAYADLSPAALNSIYCFWSPEFRRRSPGTLDILAEIDLARRLGKPYLYLGYYVAGCRSMEYKAAFRPAEILLDGAWREMEEPGGS